MIRGKFFKILGTSAFAVIITAVGVIAYLATYNLEFLSPHYTKEIRGVDFKRLAEQSILLDSSVFEVGRDLRRRGFSCETQAENSPRKSWEAAVNVETERLYCVYERKSQYEYRTWSIIVHYDSEQRVVGVDATTGAIMM